MPTAHACLTAFALLAMSFSSVGSAQTSVTGTATYRERIALSPEAVFEATLEDISLADAPAKVLGRIRLESPGQVPIAFEIPYDDADIDERYSYAVRARILVGGQLMFTSDTVHSVLTRGHGSEVKILMVRVARPRPEPEATGPIGDLPATFFGELPCASCPGIRTTLTLRSDNIFLERWTYIEAENGRDKTVRGLGRWSLSDDGKALTLQASSEGSRRLAVDGPDGIRMLDNLGQEIDSELNYTLTRVAPDPIEDTMRLRGMYTYMADAARFGECLTGLQRPVAFEKDSVALERAYLGSRTEPGAPLLATFDGRLAERPAMEGDGTEEVFIVDAFDAVWPGETCEPSKPDVTLTNTYWRLVELDGDPAKVAEGQKEPHIRLQPEEGRVTGSGGCNNMMGGYELDGTKLTFGPMASTMMACSEGMEQEHAFGQALDAITGYLIIGETLQLWDEGGLVRARLEATYFD